MAYTTRTKRNILTRLIAPLYTNAQGESCSTILRYFVPEFITSLLIYSLLYMIDARFIAELRSTAIYATVGTVNTVLHFLVKIAEGFSVGTIVMVGAHNGIQEFKQAGKSLLNAFWMTFFAGIVVALLLWLGAPFIFSWYGFSQKMIAIGVPFLRLRSISVFLMFIYFALVGFLRGIKQPLQSMYIFIAGSLLFLFFDYALIFGKFGLPALGAQGSAWAAIIQYSCMLLYSVLYIIFNKNMHKYFVFLGNSLWDKQYCKQLWDLSWPIMIDKGVLALGYLWLGSMIAPMGKYAIASYTVIKDLERIAILPAAAFAQVITYVVSNAYAQKDWQGIKATTKRTIGLASLFVFTILVLFSVYPSYFIALFDIKNKFTSFSAQAFPLLSILVFFDLLQLILSGALRGAQNVQLVMYVRLAICLLYFVPVSWLIAHITWQNDLVKFLMIYGSFYIGNGLMSLIYLQSFRGGTWIQPRYTALFINNFFSKLLRGFYTILQPVLYKKTGN